MTLFEQYLQSYSNKNIAVIGIGISNIPLIKLLCQNGANVLACDKKSKEDLGEIYNELLNLGVKFNLGEDYLTGFSHYDIIFRTPGLHPNALKESLSDGAVLTSEMEVFLKVCPCKIIAVTGSDGKTTSTTLVYEILKSAGFNCHLGGNIGKPLLCDTKNMSEDDIVILELSSFQLMTLKDSPHISAITNITPNHLDMHTDMDEYTLAKQNIYKFQNKDDICVLNADDEISKTLSPDCNTLYFSMLKALENGAYLNGDDIVFSKDGKSDIVMKRSDIKIPGKHNIANYLTAICIVSNLCDLKHVKTVAQNFGGVSHRIELVRTINDVSYYNDSIASSPTRTIAGLNAFNEEVILIAGGYDKNLDYSILGDVIVKNVKKLILVGNTKDKIKNAVLSHEDYDGKPEIFTFTDFEKAVKFSREISQKGDKVILSPASASFDMFANFAERGNKFKDIVNKF